ncbi:nuclear pore complex protein Nup133 isoform X1 [Stigmatopora nigra]
MFSPRGGPSSARRQQNRTPARRTSSSLLFTPRRTPLSGRPTPTREQGHAPSDGLNYDLETFGSSLPVQVMEVLTVLNAEEQISVKISESGWAWMVCGDRLIIWKISQTAVTKLCVCKELQLPNSQYDYTAENVALTATGSLQMAPVQGVSVLAVAAEGTARLWPSLSQEGNYSEAELDLGDLCAFVLSVTDGSFVVSSGKSRMLRVTADVSGRIQNRALVQGQGMLSGIGRRVSSLFGILSPPPDENLQSLLWVDESRSLYALTNSRLNKWEMDANTEQQTISWDVQRALNENIADAIWGSEGNYEEMRAGINVSFLDMKFSQSGLVILAAAWHPSDTPCLVYYCLVTLQDHGDFISNQFVVEVTNFTPNFQSNTELYATRLLVPPSPGTTAFLYNEDLVFACSTGSGRVNLPDEKILFGSAGDGVRGAGCCANLPVFFSLKSGLVAVLARKRASILPETVEESLCSSLAAGPEVPMMEQPTRATEPVAQEDKPRLLKAAFLQFSRNDLMGAQALIDELFPASDDEAEGGELDAMVTQIDLDLLDDYPASDPRWAESVPDESSAVSFPLTSLIILHQLEDKMKAHSCFMDFLLQVGLMERLGHVWVRSSPMATRLLLCEHAEKLQAAMVLKNHHSKNGELVNRAIGTALSKNNAVVPPGLTGADVFFREVSQISAIFDCLLEEEERSLKENPVDSVQWADVVLTVNTIIKDILHAAGQYRESKASIYRASEHATPDVEYIPWTALGGVGGIRSVICRQHELILRSMYPHADSELRSVLCEQLVALLDFYLGGYVSQLNSLKPQERERYNTLEMEYCQRRSELLTPLLELGQYQWVAALAEKYCDFDVLVQMCERTDNESRLQHYMSKFQEQNFADFLFRWYMEKGKRGKLLSQPAAQHQQLAGFLQAHQHLSWLHDIHVQHYQAAHKTLYKQANAETRYFAKKKTLLALSKLAALVSDLPEDERSKKVDEIVDQERFLLHQETLPRQLLEDKQQNPDTMPLLSAYQLVQLYICEDNRRANEYDFKKALDLLEYIQEQDDEVNIHLLKCQIFGKALRRDDWAHADGSDDPLEAAKDSVFVKILVKLIEEGVGLQTYLPEVKELLELDELSPLTSKAYFEFVLRANYEHYLQAQM